MLGDIAVLTGGNAIFKDLGVQLDAVKLSDLGSVDRVIISADDTTMVGSRGDKKAIAGRADQIRKEIETTTSDYDREKLEERLAKLAGGVAQISVGAATETEMKERKFLLDDARAATKAALEEGIVAGGGVALFRCKKAVDALQLEGDEGLGAKILRNVLQVPLKAIADNAGQDGPVVVNRVRQLKKNEGYDADKDTYGDMLEAGIVDPAKVVRTALQNAVSVACLLLTTSCLITDIPKKDDGKGAGPGAGPDMGGGMGGMGGMGGGMGGMVAWGGGMGGMGGF